MRGAIATIVLVLVAGGVATHVRWPIEHAESGHAQTSDDGWRRTVDGWEYHTGEGWFPIHEAAPDRATTRLIHPWLLAALQVLASVIALAASRTTERRALVTRRPEDEPAASAPRHSHGSAARCRA